MATWSSVHALMLPQYGQRAAGAGGAAFLPQRSQRIIQAPPSSCSHCPSLRCRRPPHVPHSAPGAFPRATSTGERPTPTHGAARRFKRSRWMVNASGSEFASAAAPRMAQWRCEGVEDAGLLGEPRLGAARVEADAPRRVAVLGAVAVLDGEVGLGRPQGLVAPGAGGAALDNSELEIPFTHRPRPPGLRRTRGRTPSR